MAETLTPAKLAKLLHECFLEANPENGAKAWSGISAAWRRSYLTTARVLLERLAITPKEKARG